MSKSQLRLVVVLLFLLCCLSACQKQNSDDSMEKKVNQTVSSDSEGIETVKNGSHINQKLSSGVEIDADIERLESVDLSTLKELKAKLVVQNYETAKQLFLSHKEIVEETNEKTPESLTNSPFRICQTRDNYSLSSTGENLYFGGELADKINYIFSDGGYLPNCDKFLTGAELDFQSMEQARQEVEKVIEKLGISVAQNPICYTMDYETLDSEYKKVKEAMGENTDEVDSEKDEVYPEKQAQETFTVGNKDECYLFVYQVLANGVPISSHENGVYGDGSYTAGTAVRCLYSAEGIVQFNVDYQFQVTETAAKGKKGLELKQALQLLDQKYNSIILEGKYVVDRIEFEYIPMPENGTGSSYALVPAWRFFVGHTYEVGEEGKSDKAMTVTQRNAVAFHAITSEELLIDAGGE